MGLFGGGLARFSGGRFDHWHQLNSGLVNDVVYGVAIENDNVWAATTAGASRYNTVTGEWSIFTEKNAPMEEIWNYGVCYADGLVHLGVWGSGVLEYDIARDAWKDYLDPDGEMEIDLYRDDGIVHVITTGVSHVDRVLWVTTYFGACRYDRRHWRGLFAHECGLPSDFNNSVKGRSAHEAWFATDKGLGVLADFETDTWVTYTSDQAAGTGQAVIQRGEEVLATVDTGVNLPHNYALWVDLAGDDAWVGTSKGLAHAVGTGYYPRLRPGPAPVGRAAQSTKADPPEPAPTAEPDQRRLLEHIDVGPYDVPGLSLRKDSNYAHSATDVEPFRHVTPFKEHFLEQMEYTGPGRAVAEPADLDSVKLGFIGPIMPTVSVATGGKSHAERLGIAMLRGAQLAVEQANARGGYRARGIPFELVISNDNGLWGASGNEIIKLAYRDKVWAILGTIDGANSHIAIRVALKAEIAMMNTGDTDPTFIETNIPWVLRCIGDDRQMGYLLVDHLYRKLGYTRVGIIRASNRYGRFGVREIKDGSRRLGHPVIIEMAYQVGAEDYGLQIDRLARSDLQAIVHWGDARDGALILRQLRDRGLDQPFFACDRCVSEEFLELAGDYAEGVTCGYPWNPADPGPGFAAFRDAYVEHYNAEPGTYAAHAYDGMNLLIDAVQRAGLNRAKMRDVLAHRAEPYPGVTGEIPFSACLDDLGEVFLARVEGGQWRYHSRAELDIPQGPIAPRDRASRKTAVLPSAAPPHVDFRAHEPSYAGPVPAVGTNEPAGASVGAAPGVARASCLVRSG